MSGLSPLFYNRLVYSDSRFFGVQICLSPDTHRAFFVPARQQKSRQKEGQT
jgi:hypothetical protein